MTPENNEPLTVCDHPDTQRRSWAAIPNLDLQWCARCGSLQFADKEWKTPELIRALDRETEQGSFTQAIVRGATNEANRQIERRSGPINIDARQGPVIEMPQERRQPASAAKHARCGNCGEKLPLTGDAEVDHDTAMKHKQTCRYTTVAADAAYSHDQYRQLIREHAAQPMQVAFREAEQLRIEQEERLMLTGSKNAEETSIAVEVSPSISGKTSKKGGPWWKFW